jgi:spore maturation protein CgeB
VSRARRRTNRRLAKECRAIEQLHHRAGVYAAEIVLKSACEDVSQAVEVPAAWFFLEDVPEPVVVRASERPVTMTDIGRVEYVNGRISRDVSILEVTSTGPGGREWSMCRRNR